MGQVWRLIDTGCHNGFYNMALDEAIATACREGVVMPTLRFYTWAPPCMSIGYFQKIDRMLTKIRFEGDTTEIVRRVTGGRAVFHGNDLSYSVICHAGNSLFPDNIKGTFSMIAEAFVSGLKHLGITPDPPKTRNLKLEIRNSYHSALCFTTTLGHEISVNGRKLIGSAQRRWSDVFLQHGSILITGYQQDERRASISLSEILGGDPDVKAVTAALCTGFRETLGIILTNDSLTKYEIELTGRLIEEKYSKSSWNLKYV